MVKKIQTGNKDHSIIFLTVVIALFIVAVVGFNMETISGQAINLGRTTISVNPKIISAGDDIEISVNPGKGCVNRFIGIYDDSDLRKATTQYRGGTQTVVCKPFTATYKTSTNWKPKEDENGIFFVKTFDYGKDEFVKTSFTIRSD